MIQQRLRWWMNAVVGARAWCHQISFFELRNVDSVMLGADHSVHPPPQSLLDGCPLLDSSWHTTLMILFNHILKFEYSTFFELNCWFCSSDSVKICNFPGTLITWRSDACLSTTAVVRATLIVLTQKKIAKNLALRPSYRMTCVSSLNKLDLVGIIWKGG